MRVVRSSEMGVLEFFFIAVQLKCQLLDSNPYTIVKGIESLEKA
jgi:hypothetical protein